MIAEVSVAAALLDGTSELARALAAGKRRGKLAPHHVATLAACVRVAGGAGGERALAGLAVDLRDGEVRGAIVDVLLGWQTGMKPAGAAQLATILDDRDATDEVVLRGALWGLQETSPKKASVRRRELLAAARGQRSGRAIKLARAAIEQLESFPQTTAGGRERRGLAWLPDVAPLVVHPNRELASSAQGLVAHDGETFLAFLAWVLAHDVSRKMIAVVDGRIYWASLPSSGSPRPTSPRRWRRCSSACSRNATGRASASSRVRCRTSGSRRRTGRRPSAARR